MINFHPPNYGFIWEIITMILGLLPTQTKEQLEVDWCSRVKIEVF